MTVIEDNSQIYFPREISESPPQEAQPRSIEIFGEAILNLKGHINCLLPEGPVIICFIHRQLEIVL